MKKNRIGDHKWYISDISKFKTLSEMKQLTMLIEL